MNRKVFLNLFASLLVFSTLAFLAGCSSSSTPPPPTIAITAQAPTSESATVNQPFGALSALVTSNGSPAANLSVTFTVVAGSSGAAGSFATTGTTDTETTNSSGIATTSQTLTANGTVGTWSVTATASGASTPATFNLTNTAAVSSNTYVFYASGEEEINDGPNYYAVAGAVTIDANGDVLGGEEDYNDAFGLTSPNEPTPDTIAAANGALVVDPTTGLGTLTLTSSYTSTGVGGVQTFAIQFVNVNHALITQFDGTATSSGSFDLQTLASPSGSFAFAISGVNPDYDSVAFGGVYTGSAGTLSGTIDVNDADFGVVTGTAFTGTPATTDSFGRTVVTGISNPAFGDAITFVSYAVGPEALRVIDVDTTDSAIGSAFGQGTGTFTDASLGSSTGTGTFTLLGQWTTIYATLGQFATDTNGNITGGIADDNELDNSVQLSDSSIAGSTYDLTSSGINGYGTITLTGTGDVSALGLYMTDPALNLNDPNNTTTDVGGALVIDLDSSTTGSGVALPGGMGVITPQTDTTATDFNGNYAAGFQNFNDFDLVTDCGICELDMVGPFTETAGSPNALSTASIGADDSDPFGTISGLESTGDVYSSAPTSVSAGYFSNSPLDATIGGVPGAFDSVDIYQASGTTLYWIEFDAGSAFLGPIEQQGSLTGIPAGKRTAPKAQAKKSTNGTKTFGGTVK